MEASINIEQVVKAYNAVRDARTVKRHAWEKEDALLEADSDRLKVFLLGQLNATGAKSIATDSGTVYRSEKIKPSAADWGAIWEWAKDNDGFEIVEKRLKAAFIKEYMEANGGQLPPGVNVHREFEVSVRRPNASATQNGEENGNGS